MAEGVTYADLRFAKSPPEKSRPPGEAPPEDCSEGEGELTYENLPAAPRPCQPTAPGPDPQPPGALLGRGTWSLVPLALLGACLFLLATCLGLGLRYWQVSRALEGASQRHRVESSALAERLGGREENLTQTLRLLARTQAELSTTRLALWQSWQDGNSTRQQLEGEQKRAENCLASLQQEKEKGARELEAARSCQQMGCCPPGWTLFRWKCLRVSGKWKTWEGSRWDCGEQEAQLLILKPWDAGTLWGATVIKTLLQSGVFWIGLNRESKWNGVGEWHWVDGARYTGTETFSYWSDNCVKMSGRALEQETCSSSQRYICEKAATPFSYSIDPSA